MNTKQKLGNMVQTPLPEGEIALQALAPLNRLVMVCGTENAPAILQAFDVLEPHSVFSPFQRQPWLSSWQAHVGKANASLPVTIIGYIADQPVMLLLLSRQHTRSVSTLVWRAEDYCDYCSPLLHPSFADDFSHQLFSSVLAEAGRALGGIDIAILKKQPKRLQDFSLAHHSISAVPYHVSAHATRLTTDWQTYSREKRSGKTLRKIKARLNVLSTMGKVEIGFATSKPEAISLVIQCLDLKTSHLRKLG